MTINTHLSSFNELCVLKGIKIVNINCCSIVNKIDQIRLFLLKDSLIDVLCVTETWLKPHHESSLFSIDGYCLFRFDRLRKHDDYAFVQGGGIAYFVRDHIECNSAAESICTPDVEIASLNIKTPSYRVINLTLVYRPPSGNISSAFGSLQTIASNFADYHRSFSFVLGDFNIDVKKKCRGNDSKFIESFCFEHGLSQLITLPTRYQLKTHSIIDLIMTDCNIISHTGTVNFICSDHLPIFVVLKKAKEVYQNTAFQGRSYRSYDKDAFQSRLTEYNWGRLYGCFDVNDAWDILFKKLCLECDRMCPVKTFFIRKDHPPWFNNDILEMAANRDALFSEAQRAADGSLLDQAKKLKNLVKHRLANIKRIFHD